MRRNYRAAWKPLLGSTLLLLLLPGLGLAQDDTGDAGNLYNTYYDIGLGERYFQRQCSRCHGQDAKGTDETGAPDLTGRLANANTDVGIFGIIREGIAGTAMLPVSADTPDATVWQLVAYINSLRTDPASVELPGSAVAGQTLFNGPGNCLDCHMVNGSGGRQGPDLSRVGERRSPDELKTDINDPDLDVDPRWWTVRATKTDGTVLEGLRMGEDTFTMRLMDTDANLFSFAKNQIESYERVMKSTMPGYAQSLTETQVDDLVAYLFSLRKENE